jgi:hypothetical protein
MNKVMIIGLGDVGGHQLELFARTKNITIAAADINKTTALRQIYSARTGAAHLGNNPDIQFKQIDLNNIDETATILKETNPDIIMHNATLMSNFEWARLPKEIPEKITAAGIANVVPCHLTLTYKLMKAVTKTNLNSHIIMSPYPDVVNCMLGRAGLAQNLIGLGNLDYITPGIQKAAADKLQEKIENITVYLIAPYAVLNRLFRFGDSKGLPYILKINNKETDITNKLNIKELLLTVGKYLSHFTIHHLGYIAACSGVKNALAILNNTNQQTHAPGPLGLPGGYPIKLNKNGAKITLPYTVTIEEAIQTNEQALLGDGIEQIKKDGTIIFTDRCQRTWKEVLDYDCKELKVKDCEKRAKEILSLHKKHLQKINN